MIICFSAHTEQQIQINEIFLEVFFIFRILRSLFLSLFLSLSLLQPAANIYSLVHSVNVNGQNKLNADEMWNYLFKYLINIVNSVTIVSSDLS